MSAERTVVAIAAVIAGVAFLVRKAGAAQVADELEEITVIPTVRTGSLLDRLVEVFVPGAGAASGIRSNNPMNIRETSITWQGELPHDGDGYEDFDTPANGIRAGAKNLLSYYRRHGLNNIDAIIRRWAPPEDNNPTENYIRFVAQMTGFLPHQVLNVEDVGTLVKLCAAIIEFENGSQPYSLDLIRQAVRSAL